jgi:hypothetical protein
MKEADLAALGSLGAKPKLKRELYQVEVSVGKTIVTAIETAAFSEEEAFELARKKLRFKTQKIIKR